MTDQIKDCPQPETPIRERAWTDEQLAGISFTGKRCSYRCRYYCDGPVLATCGLDGQMLRFEGGRGPAIRSDACKKITSTIGTTP